MSLRETRHPRKTRNSDVAGRGCLPATMLLYARTVYLGVWGMRARQILLMAGVAIAACVVYDQVKSRRAGMK